jgi:hypothetical protein
VYLDKVASYRRSIFPSTVTKVQIVVNLLTESDILGMGRTEEIRDGMKVQEEVIEHQAVWDAGPWLDLVCYGAVQGSAPGLRGAGDPDARVGTQDEWLVL